MSVCAVREHHCVCQRVTVCVSECARLRASDQGPWKYGATFSSRSVSLTGSGSQPADWGAACATPNTTAPAAGANDSSRQDKAAVKQEYAPANTTVNLNAGEFKE